MPNWCDNSFTVTHKDPEMVRKFIDGVNAGNLFETLVPLTTKEWDYNTAVNEWGTKWDVCGGYADPDIDENSALVGATGWFQTAWGPGIEAYRRLTDLGFDLDVTYHESGMCFAGHYSEDDDYYVEYDFENADWREGIDDEDVLELLENEYENWQMWNEDEP
jgi:hypothetical protein